ncbi:MAG: ribosome biogenesis GTPase YlqF [Pseudohongiellaceae bacterium]
MSISWYPGHMHKASKEMAKLISQIDMMIEVLDARMPLASSNPRLRELRGPRPCLHILNKADLADPVLTGQWLAWFNRQPGSHAVATDPQTSLKTADLVRHGQRLLQQQGRTKPKDRYQILIAGIPNVGKSTIMNRLLGRKVAKTGNEPAVTKGQQRIRLQDGWYLYDTPGLLWPRLEDQDAAYRLAMAGAIRNTAMEFEDVAFFAAELLQREFPQVLRDRYDIENPPADVEALLTLIAARRGCLRKNGQPDWHRVSERLLQDYRSGQLGRLTLERPPAPDSAPPPG